MLSWRKLAQGSRPGHIFIFCIKPSVNISGERITGSLPHITKNTVNVFSLLLILLVKVFDFGPDCNNYQWVLDKLPMNLCTNILFPHRMNDWNDFGDPLTFHLEPSAVYIFNLFNTLVWIKYWQNYWHSHHPQFRHQLSVIKCKYYVLTQPT